MSSMQPADLGEQLADLDAALAVRRERERRGHQAALRLRPLGSDAMAGRLLAVRTSSSTGLGSNVSTCDGPPFMNRKMTRFARAGKCGGLGASGFAGTAASEALAARLGQCPASARTPASPRAPKPPPIRQSHRAGTGPRRDACGRGLIHPGSHGRGSLAVRRAVGAGTECLRLNPRRQIRSPRAGPGRTAPSGSGRARLAARSPGARRGVVGQEARPAASLASVAGRPKSSGRPGGSARRRRRRAARPPSRAASALALSGP